MASDAVQSALLSKLESLLTSHSSEDIHSFFSDHLRPFSDLATRPKKPSKAPAGCLHQQSSIRSLVKQYLSFLNRSLSLLPKLLSAPRPDQSHLFETYGLCLDCLDSLSSQLACKPCSVHVQRLRYLHCFESCGLYADAMSEGFTLLESLCGIDFGGGGRVKGRGRLLPLVVKQASEDREFAALLDFGRLVAVVVLRLARRFNAMGCVGSRAKRDGGTAPDRSLLVLRGCGPRGFLFHLVVL